MPKFPLARVLYVAEVVHLSRLPPHPSQQQSIPSSQTQTMPPMPPSFLLQRTYTSEHIYLHALPKLQPKPPYGSLARVL
jgi:hypothetical protein